MLREIAKKHLREVLGPQNVSRVNSVRNFFKKKRYHVLIDTTNSCNYRCIFCSRNNNRVVRMKTSVFDTILSKIHTHTGSLQLCCAWEYSIAKNAAEIVQVLGEYRIRRTAIYTNGSLLPDKLAKAVIDARINDFVISIGEAKKGTYERIRKGGNFERVLTNIRKLDRLKKEHNSNYPRLCANLTLINSNIGELPEFIDLADDLGIEDIRGRHLILNEGLDMDNEIIRDKVYANNIIEFAKKKASRYRISFSVPQYSERVDSKLCRAPWHQLYISSNGDVSVCPRIHLYARIGNLIHEDLRSVIRSREMKDLRNQFNKGDFKNPVCRICMANKELETPIDQGF